MSDIRWLILGSGFPHSAFGKPIGAFTAPDRRSADAEFRRLKSVGQFAAGIQVMSHLDHEELLRQQAREARIKRTPFNHRRDAHRRSAKSKAIKPAGNLPPETSENLRKPHRPRDP